MFLLTITVSVLLLLLWLTSPLQRTNEQDLPYTLENVQFGIIES